MTGELAAQSAVRSMVLGDVRLTYVVDGSMAMRASVFLPSVPSWGPADLDPDGRVLMSAGGLLVERDGRSLLIDAGYGPLVHSDELGDVDCGAMPETLAALGTSVDDIEVVAFTHLHPDHIGWAFRDGVKTFPHACYVLAREEWAPTFSDDVTLFESGDEIFPGVHALVTPGHTAGHTSYVITSGDDRLIAFGDAFHHPVQLAHVEYGSLPDLDSTLVPIARRALLRELATPNTLAFACHFGDQPFGRVVGDTWQPIHTAVLAPPPRG